MKRPPAQSLPAAIQKYGGWEGGKGGACRMGCAEANAAHTFK